MFEVMGQMCHRRSCSCLKGLIIPVVYHITRLHTTLSTVRSLTSRSDCSVNSSGGSTVKKTLLSEPYLAHLQKPRTVRKVSH